MRKSMVKLVASTCLLQFVVALSEGQAQAPAEKTGNPEMAPLDRYLIPSEASEIALARSAAPASISDDADVMVLRKDGYATAVKGKNGFVCVVERSWGTSTDDPQFWNPKMRAPHCFNSGAARTFLPIYLMKTELVLAGRSKAEILMATTSALDRKELPALDPNAMVYMMSKQQYLNDTDMSWHPHLMFIVTGDAAKSWGANQSGSPIMAANDPEERATIFFVVTGKWSDGTVAQPMAH